MSTDDWRTRAACRREDPELWFPEAGDNGADAKAVCGRCPVQPDCLEYAVVSGQTAGIWAGENERGLRRLRAERGLTRPVKRVPVDRVCQLAGQGWSNRQIADEVGCHVTSIQKVLRRVATT